MLDFIEEPLQSRLMQKLMKDSVQDGGEPYSQLGRFPHSPGR